MDLDHLRTFATVVRAGSFTEAAHALGISQSTVTAHVQALEAAVGFPLVERSVTGATATIRGAELARDVTTHIDALDDIGSLLATPRDQQPLQLGGPAELLSTVLVPAIARVIATVGAPIRLTFGLADDLVESLARRSLDVVVSATRPATKGVRFEPLYDEEFVLVGAPSLATAPLETVPVVAYAENLPIIRRYWRSVFGVRPDGLVVAAIVPDLRGIRDAVIAGAGMSVLPTYLVSEQLAAGQLVVLHEPEVAPLNTVFIATRSVAQSPRVAALVTELKRLTAPL